MAPYGKSTLKRARKVSSEAFKNPGRVLSTGAELRALVTERDEDADFKDDAYEASDGSDAEDTKMTTKAKVTRGKRARVKEDVVAEDSVMSQHHYNVLTGTQVGTEAQRSQDKVAEGGGASPQVLQPALVRTQLRSGSRRGFYKYGEGQVIGEGNGSGSGGKTSSSVNKLITSEGLSEVASKVQPERPETGYRKSEEMQP